MKNVFELSAVKSALRNRGCLELSLFVSIDLAADHCDNHETENELHHKPNISYHRVNRTKPTYAMSHTFVVSNVD